MFYELRKPQQETEGMHKDKWYVIAKSHPKGTGLVNDGSYELKTVMWTEVENSIFYFETEADAFKASAEYYTKHGKPYPALMDCTTGADPSETQHEVMRFK